MSLAEYELSTLFGIFSVSAVAHFSPFYGSYCSVARLSRSRARARATRTRACVHTTSNSHLFASVGHTMRPAPLLLVLLTNAVLVSSFSGAPPYVLRGSASAAQRSQTTMMWLFSPEKRIALRELDERRVVAALRALVTKANRWKADEWRVFGAPPLQFSSNTLSDGVRLTYYLTSDAGRLTEDGSLDVTLQGSAVVWSRQGRARPKNEDVLFRLLLNEFRSGTLADCCALAPGLYPPSGNVARLVAKVDAACLVNKKGQYERF